MTAAAPVAGRPWYAQFWPWVLIALPGVSIAVSVTALVFAVAHPDPLVGSDWYKRGLAINQDLDRDAAAARFGVAAAVTLAAATQEIVVTLEGGMDPDVVTVELQHPTIAGRDRRYVLARDARGAYRAALAGAAAGRWYVTVAPAEGGWRLAASLRLQSDVPARLVPAPRVG